MKRLSIDAAVHTKEAWKKDKQRMKKSDRQATEKEKRKRQGIKFLRTQREEGLRDAEGVTYEAEAF